MQITRKKPMQNTSENLMRNTSEGPQMMLPKTRTPSKTPDNQQNGTRGLAPREAWSLGFLTGAGAMARDVGIKLHHEATPNNQQSGTRRWSPWMVWALVLLLGAGAGAAAGAGAVTWDVGIKLHHEATPASKARDR
jgi:hypothetical protein